MYLDERVDVRERGRDLGRRDVLALPAEHVRASYIGVVKGRQSLRATLSLLRTFQRNVRASYIGVVQGGTSSRATLSLRRTFQRNVSPTRSTK